jgi:hypothetical protein
LVAPPLLKADLAIVIHIHLIEELIQFCRTDCHTGPAERGSQLSFIQSTIVVLVYTPEKLPQLPLCVFNKDSELIILDSTVTRSVDNSKDIVKEVIGVFEGMVDFAKALFQTR